METLLDKAFAQIKREDFVLPELKPLASIDEALPIGWGQTISQPFTVRFMLEKLEPKRGEKILDIGAGSGWTTALLAHMVGGEGKVVGIEVLASLKEFGERNVAKYHFQNVEFLCRNGTEGYAKEAPFDKILVSASLEKKQLPKAWKQQLKIGGKIVLPIKDSLWVFKKKDANAFEETEYPGFVFVPFVSGGDDSLDASSR